MVSNNISDRSWDLFISHASEDKDDVVRPLARALTAFGLKVWYDETELRMGDSLSESINRGLTNSSYGLVILSPSFFEKDWPQAELRGLFSQSLGTDRKILPVWHGLTHKDLVNLNPMLADLLAENTNQPIEHLALKIVQAINPNMSSAIIRKSSYNAQIRGAKPVAIEANKLSSGPVRHASFPIDLVNRIKLIRWALMEVYPDSIERWIEGFQRDSHPTSEIEIWERIASAYVRVNELVSLSVEDKKALYAALLSATMMGPRAFSTLENWDESHLAALLDALTAHPEYFAEVEQDGNLPEYGEWLNVETFTGEEAKIDHKYVDEVSSILEQIKIKEAKTSDQPSSEKS